MTTDGSDTRTPSTISRWERSADVPLLVLALASIPLVVVEDLGGGAAARGAVIANWVIWALFAVDLTAAPHQGLGVSPTRSTTIANP